MYSPFVTLKNTTFGLQVPYILKYILFQNIYNNSVKDVLIERTFIDCYEKLIQSSDDRATIGNREAFQFYRRNFQHEQSELLFHIPPHSEQSTFTLDFISMAFNKKFQYKNHFYKMQVVYYLYRGFTVFSIIF